MFHPLQILKISYPVTTTIMWTRYLILPLTFLGSLSFAASTFSPARPPSIPLAVKSPYLNCWQQAGSNAELGGPGYVVTVPLPQYILCQRC